MFGRFKLGRFFGTDLFIHGSFWLLPAFILFSHWSAGNLAGVAEDVGFVFGVFGCVVLHEYGHVLAAKAYGIRTRDITLYPIGGAASLERMPEKPLPEIAIALAGPAVNLLLAMGLGVGVAAEAMMTGMIDLNGFIARLAVANVILLLFNLLPAFPMDGGRVLRATLQFFTDRVRATDAAAVVGKVVAVGMFGIALWTVQPFLMVLAASVFLLGSQEAAAVRQIEAHRRQRRWADYSAPAESAARDGWEYDATLGMWTEWRNGYAVRRFRRA